MAESSCRNVMVEVVAWSRRVFASSDARRIRISADEFNRKSSPHDLEKRETFLMKNRVK